MTNQEIEQLAEQNHYVNQLVSLKSIFGLESKCHIVGFGDCHTIADLVKAKCCSERFLVIDDHWENLEILKPNPPKLDLLTYLLTRSNQLY